MALIAVDICNTLADINKVLQEELGPNPDTSKYYHPGVTKDFFSENLWVFDKAEVFPGAVEIVNKLAKNHKIIYLTARPQKARAVTLKWLARHGFPKAPVIISTQKAKVANKLGISLAIDDAPHEIKSLRTVTNVLVHAQPYNIGLGRQFAWEDPQLLGIIEELITPAQTHNINLKTRLAYQG